MRPLHGDMATATVAHHGPSSRVHVGSPLQRSVIVRHHASSAALIRRELSADLAATCTARADSVASSDLRDVDLRDVPERLDDPPTDLLDDAAAVATELVGNAVRHARALPGGVIRVEWRRYRDGLEIRVTDGGSPQSPVLRRVGSEALNGRGLVIVASLSARWGISPVDRGRCVWAYLGQASQVAS